MQVMTLRAYFRPRIKVYSDLIEFGEGQVSTLSVFYFNSQILMTDLYDLRSRQRGDH